MQQNQKSGITGNTDKQEELKQSLVVTRTTTGVNFELRRPRSMSRLLRFDLAVNTVVRILNELIVHGSWKNQQYDPRE
jgi:hypothetical protein